MMMPETTPIPNETAKILVQNPEMRNQISRPVRKYSPSSTAMEDASPTVKAGSRMCQAITQAHCRRDNRTGSSVMGQAVWTCQDLLFSRHGGWAALLIGIAHKAPAVR